MNKNKNKSGMPRFYLSIYFFIYGKIIRFVKFILYLFCFLSKKTVNINYLIKRGDAVSNLIFKGEVYKLKQSKDIKNKKFKFFPSGKYNIPNYRVFTIRDGIVKAGTNSIFSSEGRQITNINFQNSPFDLRFLSGIKNIKLDYFNGSLLVLGVGLIEKNYSHAWTELAARAYATKLSKIKYERILIDYDTKFIREILNLIGLPENKIIFSKNYDYIKATKLIYPELINNYKEYFLNGIYIFHRRYLPSWISSMYQNISTKVKNTNYHNEFEKIYISRRNKLERKIINEEELILSLNKLGFKVIYFEDYSVNDQIYIMKCSSQVVAIHGAGLVNINFCKKGTKILELFPYYYQCAFFYMHADMCKLNYSFYIGKPSKKLWKKSPIMENFSVDINYIKKFINNNW